MSDKNCGDCSTGCKKNPSCDVDVVHDLVMSETSCNREKCCGNVKQCVYDLESVEMPPAMVEVIEQLQQQAEEMLSQVDRIKSLQNEVIREYLEALLAGSHNTAIDPTYNPSTRTLSFHRG